MWFFVRKFSEEHSGISLAYLVAADSYAHIENEILPELNKGIVELEKRSVDVICINNNANLENNIEKIVSCIINNWRMK